MVKTFKSPELSLYGGSDPADLPRYTRLDASRATGVPASTIGVWVHGMPYTTRKGVRASYAPVVTLPSRSDPRLSFNNLLEVNVLRALRGPVHQVQLRSVREAIENAKREHGIDRLLIHPKLRTSGGALFLDHYFRLVDLSNSQQLAMRDILKYSLKRVELDDRLPSFFPVPRYMDRDERPIRVSPYISFGDAVIGRRGITTHVIRSRFDAGETKEDIIADYDLRDDEFQEAILYETAA